MLFLCHNTVDKPIVRRLRDALEAEEVPTWFDEVDLPFGRPHQESLEAALQRSKAVAVVFGPHGLGPEQKKEYQAAEAAGFEIIPVLVGGMGAADLPPYLKRYPGIDFGAGRLTQSDLGRLRQVCGLVGHSRPGPSSSAAPGSATRPNGDRERLKQWLIHAFASELSRHEVFCQRLAERLSVGPQAIAVATALATGDDPYIIVDALEDTCGCLREGRGFWPLVADLLALLVDWQAFGAGDAQTPGWRPLQSKTLLEVAQARDGDRPAYFASTTLDQAPGLSGWHLVESAFVNAPIPDPNARHLSAVVAARFDAITQVGGDALFVKQLADDLVSGEEQAHGTRWHAASPADVDRKLRIRRRRFREWLDKQQNFQWLTADGEAAPPPPLYLVVPQDPHGRLEAASRVLAEQLKALDVIVSPDGTMSDEEDELAQAITRLFKRLKPEPT